MLKRTLCLSIIIAMIMTALPLNMFMANAAATAISYVDIDKSQGLSVGAVLEATPVFKGTADGTEAVTYQWVRTRAETKSHSNGSANDSRYVAIKGATEKTYTITEADAGYILKVKATYDGVTVWSGDCVAVGNILSSFSKNSVASYTLTKYVNNSTATELVLGAASAPESAAWAGKVNNSNNADFYMHIATGNSVTDGGSSYHNSGDNNLWVAEYTMQNPIYLNNILVETGYGMTHTAIPCVNVQVMYEGETTYKNWANYTDSFKTKAEMDADKYNRINMINVTGDSAMIGDDSEKKVSNIKVIVYTLKDTVNNRTDAIFLREISGFAKAVPAKIVSIDSSVGAKVLDDSISYVKPGTTAEQLVAAITADDAGATIKVLSADKSAEITGATAVADGMFVELTSTSGLQTYYTIALSGSIRYVDIQKDNGLNVGDTIAATPVFTALTDESEVTYQWVRTKVATKSHVNASAADSRYTAIAGATGKDYTITEADAGYILKVKATYDGTTVWSGDSVAVGNILSSFSKNTVSQYTLTKYDNASTETELVLGNAGNPESASWAAKVNNSNNADYYTHVATGNSVTDGGYSYHNCGDNKLWVAEYTLQTPLYLGSILVETGYGVTYTAIPCVNVQVMYEGETEYKPFANYTDAYKTKAELATDTFNRINMIHVTGDSTLIGDNYDKKISKIKVIVYTLKDTVNNRADAIFLREISGFATTVSPAIKALDESLGAEIKEYTVSNLIKGTTAKTVLDAITGNAVTVAKKIVSADKVSVIADNAYVKDGMFVELSSLEGEKIYYEICMKADIATDFNDYVGKKSYRVGSAVRGNGLPGGWAAVYSNNPEEADGTTQEYWDNATMYLDGVSDTIKGNGVGRLHNSSTTITANAGFQLTRNLNKADTMGQVVVIETSVKAGDINSNKNLNVWFNGATVGVPRVVDMHDDGQLFIGGVNVGTYSADVWYNVAVVLDLKNGTVTGYLNGDKVVDAAKYGYSGVGEETGITRIAYCMDTYKDGEILAGDFYFDDFKVYKVTGADYADFAVSNASANGVEIVPGEGTAYVVKNLKDAAPTVEAYLASLSAILPGYTVSIYNANDTVATGTAAVTEGMKVVLSGSSENAFRMYQVAYKEPLAPVFYNAADLSKPITAITNQKAVTAIVNIGSETGTMVIALYDGGKMISIDLGERIGEGDAAQLKAEISLQDAENPEVRVFLWSDLDSLDPLAHKYYIAK